MKNRYYEKAKDKAFGIIAKFNLECLPINALKLCEDMHILLYSYDSGKEIINDYKLNAWMREPGFVVDINGHAAIFYDDNLDKSNANYTVACLLGYIVSGCLKINPYILSNKDIAYLKAYAAAFADNLLAPDFALLALNVKSAWEISKLCNIPFDIARLFERNVN